MLFEPVTLNKPAVLLIASAGVVPPDEPPLEPGTSRSAGLVVGVVPVEGPAVEDDAAAVKPPEELPPELVEEGAAKATLGNEFAAFDGGGTRNGVICP